MRNREFTIHDQNTSLDPDKVRALEEKAFDTLRSRYKEVKPPHEFIEIVRSINFAALRKLFLNHAKRSGIEADSFNFVDKERILFMYDAAESDVARYFPTANAILLNIPAILKFISKNDLSFSVALAHYIIHEETHAVSAHRLHFYEEKSPADHERYDLRPGPISSGYARATDEDNKKFIAWDEGVNEKFARDILIQYLEEDKEIVKKIGPYSVREYTQKLTDSPEVFHYSENIRTVEHVINRISTHSSYSRDFLWKAIIRSKFEGQDLLDPEVRTLFDEAMGEGFIDRLARAEYSSDLDYIPDDSH